MSKLAPTRALSVDGSDYGWSWLCKERINPSLGAAGGKPARISLVGFVDRQGWGSEVFILVRGAGGRWRARPIVRSCTAFEPLDDDHAAAAARASVLWWLRLVSVCSCSVDRIHREYRQREQLTGASDVVGTFAAGEQAIIADAVEACGKHVHEEAADELVHGERHHLVALAAFEPVVLPLEGDALVVACEQAAIGDGNTMGVAGEKRKTSLGPPKGRLQ